MADELGIPVPPSPTPGPTEEGPKVEMPEGSPFDEDRASVYRDVLAVTAGLLIVTLLHYFTNARFSEAHIVFRRLYYLPIIYGAFRFGLKGGLITAVAASVLFVPHAQQSLGGLFGQYSAIENGLEVILYNVVGVATGLLATAARREVDRSRAFATELERAYTHLEQRALELSRVREYVQAILDSVVSGVMTIDRSGVVAVANPAAERILGMGKGALAGKRLCDLWEEDDGLCAEVAPLLNGGTEPVGRDVSVVVKGGRRLSLATHLSPLIESDSKVHGAVITMEDQTELKVLTEQLVRADRLAALGELVAGLAHEIRNPLAIIKGSLQIYAQTSPQTAEVRQVSKIIDQEIDRLDRVIKALLDFGRPSPARMEPMDVAKAIEETAALTHKYALQQGVDVVVKTERDLPQVMGDADQVKQVLVNLISNAVQAMPQGGTVRVGAHSHGDTVGITVADEGVGIPENELAKVFDPFHTTRDSGTGLGLTIVHRIVDEHHGRIGVVSKVGKGTTFTVSLPVARGA